MSEWIDIEDKEPEWNQLIVAEGFMFDEINGDLGLRVAIGKYGLNKSMDVFQNTYGCQLDNIRRWFPIPPTQED